MRFARLTSIAVCVLLVTIGNTASQKKPSANFYLDAAETTGESTPKKRSSEGAPTKLSQKTKTPPPDNGSQLKKEAAKLARKPAEKTPAPKRIVSKQQDPVKAAPQAAVPRAASAVQPRSYRGDIYGLASLVTQRWDFLRMLPSSEEFYQLRIDSFRRRANMLRDRFTALSRAAEKQQSNLRDVAIAAYILSVSRNSTPAWMTTKADASAAQLAVLRATLATDTHQIDSTLIAYDSLREAANLAAQQLAEAESLTSAAVAEVSSSEWLPSRWPRARAVQLRRQAFEVTENLGDLANDRTRVILADRAPAQDALQALVNAESILRQEESRETFQSFAPAPPKARPDYNPLIDPGTPIPTNFGTRKSHPEAPPVLQRPEQHAVVLPSGNGAPVFAAADGTVVLADEIRGLGRTVLLDHGNGLVSLYGYLSAFECAEGDAVKKGQPLGQAGAIPGTQTGGIRFEVRRGRNSASISELIGSEKPESLVAGR